MEEDVFRVAEYLESVRLGYGEMFCDAIAKQCPTQAARRVLQDKPKE